MDPKEIVSRDPQMVSGALVFAGTRVPVQALVDYLLGGIRWTSSSTTSPG